MKFLLISSFCQIEHKIVYVQNLISTKSMQNREPTRMTGQDSTSQLESRNWSVRALSGFVETAGPLWTRREGDAWAYGILCTARHLNPAGVVHGGTLLTLMDHAISAVAWEACERAPCVTVQLDTHFVGTVRDGQFVEARAEVSHRTRSLIFMRGTVMAQGHLVLSSQAVLKVMASAR